MMTSKKGLDLLKGIASFMTKTEGFDKCLRDVRDFNIYRTNT